MGALWRLFDGLAFRVALLLSIALVPIGLIAVSLTYRISAEATKRNQNTILALTAEAAANEESMMRAGATAAEALASALPVVEGNADQCSGLFKAFLAKNAEYSFAGYVDGSGIVACASDGVGRDASGGLVFTQMKQLPVPRIDANRRASISGQSVIVMSQPVFDANGGFTGYVAVSLPNHRSFRNQEMTSVTRPGELITFNNEGVVLSAEDGLDDVELRLPSGRTLSEFVGTARTSFRGTNARGETRIFAVVPIISNMVYAMGSWPDAEVTEWFGPSTLSSLIFPALMWLVSLGVAFLAVHRLAISNINDLRRRMQRFIGVRRFQKRRQGFAIPREFREIDETFSELAETVVRDEAELENTIHARTVLLKEVHHRVKNNLQLIASIVSMKIRKAATPDARIALKEVQNRVMSIATVHQALYTTSTIGRVQVDELLASIVSKTVEAGAQIGSGVKVQTSYDKVSLYPDQAVPLSLLASEAVTNALKYVGRPTEGEPWIRAALLREGPDTAVLLVENSAGEPILPAEAVRGTGLGANLIRAFAIQMGGQMEDPTATPGVYRVRVAFPIIGFEEAPAGGIALDEPAERHSSVK